MCAAIETASRNSSNNYQFSINEWSIDFQDEKSFNKVTNKECDIKREKLYQTVKMVKYDAANATKQHDDVESSERSPKSRSPPLNYPNDSESADDEDFN